MPNFKKSTGYNMKGSKFYGTGNQSPLKAVDSAVIDSQKALNKTEDTFKQPGWARVAGSVEKMAKGPLGRFKDKLLGGSEEEEEEEGVVATTVDEESGLEGGTE